MMAHTTLVWTLSDDTTVSASGEVTGESALAVEMRDELAAIPLGLEICVAMGPPPGGVEPLDLDDEASLDSWVRQKARLAGVDVVEPAENASVVDDEDLDDDRSIY